MDKLPKANQDNIGFLFNFLSKVVDEKDYNKMTPVNIVIIFGPNLLWETTIVTNLDNTVNIHHVLVTMIEEAKQLFPNTTEAMNNDQIWKDFQDSKSLIGEESSPTVQLKDKKGKRGNMFKIFYIKQERSVQSYQSSKVFQLFLMCFQPFQNL